jgi:C-methyltransferase C-terminal domain/Putative zinc binding domain
MSEYMCRFCRARDGSVVLDLGNQPACDYFPLRDDPGPDTVYPLQMWLCAECGLAQLLVDPTLPQEPRGAEPAALVAQAADAVERVAAAGWLPRGARTAEYGSPHGGSWLPLMQERGLTTVSGIEVADVVLDCFGLMHSADQAAALAERVAHVAPGGVLLLQFHSLATILRRGQWNSLRHGHYAYYSLTVVTRMLADVGFRPRSAWQFDLYGGTVLLAATRDTDSQQGPDIRVRTLLAEEKAIGVRDADVFRGLQHCAVSHAEAVHNWLATHRAAGVTVLGYGAASRAVSLLCRAGVNRRLLPAIADASPAKQNRRMPGTDVPVISPQELVAARPSAVVLLLPDLITEVRKNWPEIEAAGGCWVDVEGLPRAPGIRTLNTQRLP